MVEKVPHWMGHLLCVSSSYLVENTVEDTGFSIRIADKHECVLDAIDWSGAVNIGGTMDQDRSGHGWDRKGTIAGQIDHVAAGVLLFTVNHERQDSGCSITMVGEDLIALVFDAHKPDFRDGTLILGITVEVIDEGLGVILPKYLHNLLTRGSVLDKVFLLNGIFSRPFFLVSFVDKAFGRHQGVFWEEVVDLEKGSIDIAFEFTHNIDKTILARFAFKARQITLESATALAW
jgi:hypothetical protein